MQNVQLATDNTQIVLEKKKKLEKRKAFKLSSLQSNFHAGALQQGSMPIVDPDKYFDTLVTEIREEIEDDVRAEIEENVRAEIEQEFAEREKNLPENLRANLRAEIEQNLRAEIEKEIEESRTTDVSVVLPTWFKKLHESNKIECTSRKGTKFKRIR